MARDVEWGWSSGSGEGMYGNHYWKFIVSDTETKCSIKRSGKVRSHNRATMCASRTSLSSLNGFDSHEIPIKLRNFVPQYGRAIMKFSTRKKFNQTHIRASHTTRPQQNQPTICLMCVCDFFSLCFFLFSVFFRVVFSTNIFITESGIGQKHENCKWNYLRMCANECGQVNGCVFVWLRLVVLHEASAGMELMKFMFIFEQQLNFFAIFSCRLRHLILFPSSGFLFCSIWMKGCGQWKSRLVTRLIWMKDWIAFSCSIKNALKFIWNSNYSPTMRINVDIFWFFLSSSVGGEWNETWRGCSSIRRLDKVKSFFRAILSPSQSSRIRKFVVFSQRKSLPDKRRRNHLMSSFVKRSG